MRPFFSESGITLYNADCRDSLERFPCDVVIADPPYGDTSLEWDVEIKGWQQRLKTKSLWCFGSFRMFLGSQSEFASAGWKYSQEIIWEKHNGSSFHADRFKRVHELIVHFYRGEWREQYRDVPTTNDAKKRTVRRKSRPAHTGHIDAASYISHDGGPKLARSVQFVRSCHGYALHPTQKPLGIITPLIHYSCPPGGLIVDPFAGVGSTLLAAKLQGRRAIGFETDRRFCELAAERLRQGVLFGVGDEQ